MASVICKVYITDAFDQFQETTLLFSLQKELQGDVFG